MADSGDSDSSDTDPNVYKSPKSNVSFYHSAFDLLFIYLFLLMLFFFILRILKVMKVHPVVLVVNPISVRYVLHG